MLENYLDPVTCVLIAVSVFSLTGWIKSSFKNRELNKICKSLKKANDNLSRTCPDLKTLIAINKSKEESSTVQTNQGVKTYQAVRVKGAPDIRLGSIAEVVITATSEEKAVELLRNVPYFEDDGWWTVEPLRTEKVISVKHLGGILDD